jgi:lipid II:glycine glycyltransferase (peptidoglycan interpeptide bridge formation enzyme)
VPVPTGAIYRTIVMDLSPTVDELRAGLRKRWRRELTQSEKHAFEVEIGRDPSLFAQFRELFETFVKWKGFEVEQGPRFHERVHRALQEKARYLILLSRHEGELVYGLVLGVTGDTGVYVLGASNPALRDLRGGYYLHWRAVQELKNRGLRWYDLGGTDPQANPGVHLFKTGMSDIEACAPGPFECAPDLRRGLIVRLSESGFRRWRQLKRSGLGS